MGYNPTKTIDISPKPINHIVIYSYIMLYIFIELHVHKRKANELGHQPVSIILLKMCFGYLRQLPPLRAPRQGLCEFVGRGLGGCNI